MLLSGTIALRSHNGSYLTQAGEDVTFKLSFENPYSLWAVTHHGEDKYSFRSLGNNRLLCAEKPKEIPHLPGGALGGFVSGLAKQALEKTGLEGPLYHVNRENTGDYEIFRCALNEGKVSVRSHHNKHLSCSNEHKPLAQDNCDEWEHFTIMILVNNIPVVAADHYKNLDDSEQRRVNEERAAAELAASQQAEESARAAAESARVAEERAARIAKLKEEARQKAESDLVQLEKDEALRLENYERETSLLFHNEALFFKGQILLRSHHGTIISVDHDGSSHAKLPPLDWLRALIDVESKGNGKFALKAACNQKYLRAFEETKHLLPTLSGKKELFSFSSAATGEHELYLVEYHGSKVALKSHFNKYLSVEGGNIAHLDIRDQANEWEQFEVLVKQGDKLELAAEYYTRIATENRTSRRSAYDEATSVRVAERKSAIELARISAENDADNIA